MPSARQGAKSKRRSTGCARRGFPRRPRNPAGSPPRDSSPFLSVASMGRLSSSISRRISLPGKRRFTRWPGTLRGWAANPLALDSAGLDPAAVARERAVLAGKNAGKPAHVLEKIIESGLKAYFKEVCLLDQPSIHAEHEDKAIGLVVAEAAKVAGIPV